MDNIKRILFPVILVLYNSLILSQTTNISGIINSYASVTNISINSATVLAAPGFIIGDKVLIIQMKGVTINPTNNINYGNITSYNDAGNYELSTISNIVGNVITFSGPLIKTYNTNGIVQLVRVPTYVNATITASLTCQAWNGTTGGVLIFETNGSLTFNADINITGRGFRGGNPQPGNYTCGGDTVNYVFAAPSLYHGEKGEGVFLNSSAQSLGKGRNANGGGGGNDVNGGGGGGGNFGYGGRGGNMYTPLTCPPSVVMLCGAMGAQGLTYSNSINKVFLGGAGGTGNQNNGASPVGGNGGGIAIIRACNIVANNKSIFSDGEDMLTYYCIDGHGGGGAGGSVLLDYGTLSGGLNVSVKGGVGGSDTYGGPDCHGKGGGGGGGIVWVNNSLTGISTTLNGGAPGTFVAPTSPCFNSSLGATAGTPGSTLTGLAIPGSSALGGLLSVLGSTTICSSQTATLIASGGTNYTWTPSGLNSSSISVSPSVTTVYSVIATSTGGCNYSGSATVTVNDTPTISLVASPTVMCIGNSATLTASGAANYTWFPGNLTSANIIVSPASTTIYSLVGVNGACSSVKIFTLIVSPNPTITVTALSPTVCNGSNTNLLALGGVSYTWQPNGLTGNTISVTPSVTSQYSVTGVNLSGCKNTVVTTVTVIPSPTISVVPSSTLICSNGPVTISSSGALNYILNPGAQTGSLISVSPTITTTYSVTGINIFGCTDTKTLTIKVGSNPVLTLANSATLACSGGSLFLVAGGASNYTWMPIGLTGSAVVTTATNSISTYTLIGESEGCYSTALLSVDVINCATTFFGMTKAVGKPKLINNMYYDVSYTVTAINSSSVNLNQVRLNENLSITFPSPSLFTLVSPPIITSQNSSLTVHPLFDGVSQISLTSPTTSTLLANKHDTIVFTVRIDPKGYFGPFKNSVIGFANFLNSITVSDSTNDGFAWDPDNDGNPTNNNIPTVIELPFIDLFIPDGFTPNGDGKNDFFFIKGLNNRSVKLTVFNRWGNKVYEKSEYDNSWNAYPNTTGLIVGNDKVPPGTYYYVITFLDGDKETRTGFVVVQY